MKLTRTSIQNLPVPASGTRVTWDAILPGFGCRVHAGGRRTYVVRYRTASRVERMQTLGRVDDMPPEDARERARSVFAKVRAGADPRADLAAFIASPTVAELAKRWEADVLPFRKPLSRDVYARAIRLQILPSLGDVKVVDLSKMDAKRMFAGVVGKGTPMAANRALIVLSMMCLHAEELGWRPEGSNPCHGIQKMKPSARERMMSPEELAAFWNTLEHFGPTCIPVVPLFRLLLLTGCRVSEWRDARWSWID